MERDNIPSADTLNTPIFAGIAPLVHDERCLNLRHKAAGCTRCATACPVAAITLESGRPTLDAAGCIHCGICLHICPTEVYEQTITAEKTLLQTVASLAESRIGLICPLHPTPEESRALVDVIVRHARCLAALSAADLLALNQHGQRQLWLDDGPCATCPIGAAQATLVNTVASSNAWLALGAVVPDIALCSQNSEQLAAAAIHRPCIDGARPKLSRRGLFKALRQSTQQWIERAVDQEKPVVVDASPAVPRLPQRIPQTRQRLLQQVAQLAPTAEKMVATVHLPLAAVKVDQTTCSACNLCARFCPTGALQFVISDGEFQLNFQSTICLDCGLCALACPEDAVRFDEQLSNAVLSDARPQGVVQGKLTRCAACSAPTAKRPTDGDTSLCYSCRHGAGVVKPLVDGAGLMADLLKRL